MSGPSRLYLVCRLWRDESQQPGAGRTPLLRAFTTRTDAEAFLRERERAARRDPVLRQVNPWGRDMRWEAPTSFSPALLRDWLLDVGMEPPAPRRGKSPADEFWAWYNWWAERSPTFLDAEFARLWEAMDRFRFHEVVEVEYEG